MLYSGTTLEKDKEGAFRHLNDLYFLLFLLRAKGVKQEQITIVVDPDILDNLDYKTKGKTVPFPNANQYGTFRENIIRNCREVYDISDFEEKYQRNDQADLVFFASGHGSIHGLFNQKTERSMSPDFIEEAACESSRTILLLSQCYAGSFHHLDTRKHICVVGASEYQSSLSLPLELILGMFNKEYAQAIASNIAFYQNIAINPFIFFYFHYSFNPNFLNTKKKNLINLYKYTTASTYDLLSTIGYEAKKIPLVGKLRANIIQTPFLLNKIIAARESFKCAGTPPTHAASSGSSV